MAKDTTGQSRIPRLDGVTKIPLPGSIRTPAIQIRRPTSFTGLRPPSLAMTSLKKSLSGDRISEAASIMGKRTATVVRKFLTKPEKSAPHIETMNRKFTPPTPIPGTKMMMNRIKTPSESIPITPKMLTRSDTFVREEGESDVIKMAQSSYVQQPTATPMVDLYMTHSLDGSRAKAALEDSITVDSGQYLCRAQTLDKSNNAGTPRSTLDSTINQYRTRNLNSTQTLEKALGMTFRHTTPNTCSTQLDETRFRTQNLDTTLTKDLTNTIYSPNEEDLSLPRNDGTVTLEKCNNLIDLQSCENLLDIDIPTLDPDLTLRPKSLDDTSYKNIVNLTMEDTLPLAPDKSNMKLVLNSTMNTERLLDLTTNTVASPAAKHHFMNITRDLMGSPCEENVKNNTNLLYMSRREDNGQSPNSEPMEVDRRGSQELLLDNPPSLAMQELKNHKPRFSFGLDLTESTLDCSIELCDVSLSSTIQSAMGTTAGTPPPLKKQNSFEMDESLGILTPDQMKEFLDSTTTTTNLDLPLGMNPKIAFHQMRIDQTPSPEDLPLDPVEVKTDVEHAVIELTKTHQQQQQQQQSNTNTYNEISQTDTESKTDQMTKSNVSKISTSFITSVTSVTSLDTGYQGDGEMSRPASRGAGDHSPSNGPHRKPAQVSRQPSFNHNHPNIPIRRQDPMTDSDFFTESDADDIFHRGDRRAQVIDGQLYGPMLQQPSASVFISEQPEQMDDSCMESSGIFTDVENRCDEDISQMRGDIDMSPDDGSTDTVKSNKNQSSDPEKSSQQQQQQQQQQSQPQPVIESEFRSASPLSQGQWNNMLTDSQTSSTIQSSFSSSDRISMTTDYNPTTGNSKRNSCAVSENNKSSVASSNEALCSDTTTKASARSTGASDHTIHNINLSSVKKVSPPRKHASLSSLCSVSTKNDAKNCRSTANSSILLGDRQSQQQLASAKSSASVFNKNSGNGSGSGVGSRNGCEMPVRANTTVNTTKQQRSPLGAKHQENKNSPGLSVALSRAGSTAGIAVLAGSGSGSPTLRKISPNKWDAVMSKIAVNKMQVKKNYSEVKSKVSTGVLRRSPPGGGGGGAGVNSGSASKVSTPLQDNSPVVGNSNCSSGLASPHTKRITQGAAKRGRSYSKDSQQSSQSDLSLSSGSPKLLAKTPSRAAKKRDVRNLSISPTDLGPPPKAQQTTNGSTRTKTTPATLSQKRPSPNNNNNNNNAQQQQLNHSSPIGTTTPTSAATTTTAASATATPSSALSSTINTLKGSPPTKKVISKRLTEQKVHSKTPLKDHNRLVSQQQQQQQQQNSNNTSKTTNGGIGKSTVGGGGAIVPTSTPLLTATEKALLRTTNNSHTPPSPILNNLINNKQQPNGKCIVVGRIGTPPTSGGHILTGGPTTIKKTQKDKPKILVQEDLQEEEFEDLAEVEDQVHHQQQLQKNNNNNKLQQKRHTYNGASELDYHHLPEFQFQGKGIAALGVLLQYLVYDLDAFSCPIIKVECENVKQKLNRTLHLLDEAKTSCHELRDQIFDKESYYTKREQELQDLHRCELEKVETNLKESQNKAKEHIATLESQLATKDLSHKHALEQLQSAADVKYEKLYAQLISAQQNEEALRQRLGEAARVEDQLKEQIRDQENNFSERIQLATQRERELVEKINGLNKQLENLKSSTENRAQELENKLNLSQDEISVLRLSRSFTDHSYSTQASPRNSGGAALEIQRLQSEAESLRCVLEIKQKEISKLTKQNQELIRDADEAQVLMGKVSTLESRCEMLQSETELKAEKEKELREKLDEITKAFNHEAVVRKRLSFDKEALQWQLKQRSEQLQIVESKFHEHLSSSKISIYSTDATINQDQSHNSSLLSLNRTNGSERIQFQMDDISPPSSPIIKGVIEKNDSVSWVLEMDDETPEVAASKMVKRAGSFRSAEKSPSASAFPARRQLSVSATCGVAMMGPNPLSQSMSATSVIRQHSNDAAEFLGRVHSRIRSKSVSVKSEPKKVIRQNSSGSCRSRNNGDSSTTWKDPLCASSPYTRNNIRQRPSSSSSSQQQRTTHLITCDTSTLNTGEKLEMRSLPTHPSVHDLKKLKKCQEIQESAGEAMVSGTNSEDEGCSASSDEAVSTSSSNGTSSSSLHHKQHMSIEEVLLLDKIHSLNGTPMEVSWSDDVFASESTV